MPDGEAADQRVARPTGEPCRVSLAVSGGGHRAAAWALGALYGLLIARDGAQTKASLGSERRPVSIDTVASVSGGSITNGFLLHKIDDLSGVSLVNLRERTRPLVDTVARRGLIPVKGLNLRKLVLLYVYAAVSALAAVALLDIGLVWGRGSAVWPDTAIGYGIGLAILIAIVWGSAGLRRTRSGVEFNAPWAATLVVVVMAAVACGAHYAIAGRCGRTVVVASTVLAVVLAVSAGLGVRLAARRGAVMRDALDSRHFSKVELAALADRPTLHVFCATELQSGHHCYLSPRFVHEWNAGEGPPGQLTLATAVCASASLPGGFPPLEVDCAATGLTLQRRWAVPDGPSDPVISLSLADGGVYDNMAEEWEFGLSSRAARSALIADRDPADLLVVANAGKRLAWTAFRPVGPIRRELRGLLRDQSIEYDATTSQRRRALVAAFQSAEESGTGTVGVIAHVPTTPESICRAFADGTDDRARRARETLALLAAGGEPWGDIAARNGAVKTTLKAIGEPATVELVLHAATLTAVGCYVIHGLGDGQLPSRNVIEDWVSAPAVVAEPAVAE